VVFVNVLNLDKHYTETAMKLSGVNAGAVTLTNPVILPTFKAEVRGAAVDVELIENTDYEVVEDTDEEVYTVNLLKTFSEAIKVSYTLDGEAVEEVHTPDSFPIEIDAGATNLKLKISVVPVTTLIAGEDYKIGYNEDGVAEFEILKPARVPADEVYVSFHEADAGKVTSADIIGRVNSLTDELEGLELVESVFPKFRLVPSILIAPKYSQEVGVAAVMKAKCTGINGVFRAIAIVDLPTDEIKSYTNAAEYKNLKNLADTSLIVCYPKVSLDGKQFFLSTQLAGLMNKVDYERGDDMPYWSPSNQQLQCDSSVMADGTEKIFSLSQANYLNSQGIATALNFSNGWCFWGNCTGLYPSSTDVKDVFISVRRMFNWLANNLILSYFQKVDNPMNRRLIDNLVNSINLYMNGLAAKGAVLPGSHVEFTEAENPTTDLLNGKIKFHIYYTPPIPAQDINFVIEYDVSNLQSLFA